MDFNFKNVKFGISEKKDGSMKPNFEDGWENLNGYFKNLNINKFILAGQEHGNKVAIVDNDQQNRILDGVDGLITQVKNLFLGVTVADCIPIYFYDFEKEVIGLAHAGWRGVHKNIVHELTEKMVETFKSKPQNIAIYIGPHLRECHFEVREDVESLFKDYKEFIIKRDGKIFINLQGVIKEQLKKEGVNEKNIEGRGECTFDESKYFSFRRDKPQNVESMIAYIGLIK